MKELNVDKCDLTVVDCCDWILENMNRIIFGSNIISFAKRMKIQSLKSEIHDGVVDENPDLIDFGYNSVVMKKKSSFERRYIIEQ